MDKLISTNKYFILELYRKKQIQISKNYFLILTLDSEANTPAAQRIVNIINAVFMLVSNAAEFEYDIFDWPMNIEKISMASPILNICPVILMVDNVEEANANPLLEIIKSILNTD